MIRKVLACVRHEAYGKIQALLHTPGQKKTKLSPEELDDILEKIQQGNQEVYREKALKLYGVTVPEGDNAKRLMQKAYLVYSTVSTMKDADGNPIRARWQEQISHEHKIHGEIV